MKVIILVLGCLSLVGCGGGDGASQGGSISDSGHAVFQNFSASSVVPNVCRNFAVPTDSFACNSAGGTWSSRASYSVTSGSIDFGSYSAICSAGVPTTTCRLNGVIFSLTAGLSLDAVNACEAQGGTVEVACGLAPKKWTRFYAADGCLSSYCSGVM